MSFQIDPYELQLVEACMLDDRAAQKALYEKYCKAMYTIAYRILNDYDNANDALQDGFIQVFRDISKFKKESTLGAWIKTIIIRSALYTLKKQKAFEPLDIEVHDTEIIEWDSNMTGQHLEKAIQTLPSGYRSVFVLTEVEGYSHKETAEILNISEGTSKSQLFYAKKVLQTKLKELIN